MQYCYLLGSLRTSIVLFVKLNYQNPISVHITPVYGSLSSLAVLGISGRYQVYFTIRAFIFVF